MNNNRIGVIGIGRLGLSFALLCEQSGYEVVGYDVRQNYLDSLRDKSFSSPEPMVNEYLQAATHLMVTDQLSEVVDLCDTIFCFVQTPSLEDGSYNHCHIDSVVTDLWELYYTGTKLNGKVLVIGCTTMPGYCTQIADRLEGMGMDLIYNPEFIAQGSIIRNLKEADMVLIGSNTGRGVSVLENIYRSIMIIPPRTRVMSTTAAEITKISINCFLTMKIAYANMIGEIAIASGVEQETDYILKAIGDDSRIGHKFLGYGFGYAGPCLPRDMKALGIHADRVGVQNCIQETIDLSNEHHAEFLKEYYMKANPDINTPFIFTQLAYKPRTDILTESQHYRLCKDLLNLGYRVNIIESDRIIEQVQDELSVYEDRVTYNEAMEGYTI